MFAKLGIAVTAAALACGSACAQSILLDKGEYGWYFQGGYVDVEGLNASGGELDLGFAANHQVDFGIGVTAAIMSYGYGAENQTVVGPFLNVYPVRVGGRHAAFALGWHGAVRFHTNAGGTDIGSIGATLNLIAYASARSGVVLAGGIFANATNRVEGTTYSGLIGLNPYIKTVGGHPLSIVGQYGINEGPDSYAVGISIGMGRSREMN